jgi:hypothetical protein
MELTGYKVELQPSRVPPYAFANTQRYKQVHTSTKRYSAAVVCKDNIARTLGGPLFSYAASYLTGTRPFEEKHVIETHNNINIMVLQKSRL